MGEVRRRGPGFTPGPFPFEQDVRAHAPPLGEGNVMTMTWVVFRRPMDGDPDGLVGVVPGAEWEALNEAHPGRLTLVRAGIENEGEAERLAREETRGLLPTAGTAG